MRFHRIGNEELEEIEKDYSFFEQYVYSDSQIKNICSATGCREEDLLRKGDFEISMNEKDLTLCRWFSQGMEEPRDFLCRPLRMKVGFGASKKFRDSARSIVLEWKVISEVPYNQTQGTAPKKQPVVGKKKGKK